MYPNTLISFRWCLGLQKNAIELRYRCLGMKSKLKFLQDGRLEVVGMHFRMIVGDFSGQGALDVKRSLRKIGVCASLNDAKRAVTVSRFCSLAVSWSGSSETIARLFLNLTEHTAECFEVDDTHYKVDMYEEQALLELAIHHEHALSATHYPNTLIY